MLSAGHYATIIGWSENIPVAVATITETYALYAGGKIGIIQEFYVIPEFRCLGVGAMLFCPPYTTNAAETTNSPYSTILPRRLGWLKPMPKQFAR
ncbi:MAG: hypothetical protein LUQ28_03020, partial [Methylococcaceae bacterium]|nr:hypothetical protein [Methylococcaceae bacterium]